MRIECPAKVNLFLAVGERDERGYHPIQTVFQAISLHDTLELERTERDSFECDVELPERNTVTRAWALMREVVPMPKLHVRLTKRIPSEAGLGGGSSDAAGFIRGVQKLLSTRVPMGELQGLALAVGADVPFFLVGGRAWAEGYGEHLKALEDLPAVWMVVAKPPVGCSTATMFRALDDLDYPRHPFVGYHEGQFNDFERVAPGECLSMIRDLRELGAMDAGLTGSGSAVFGSFRDESAAQGAANRIEASHRGFVRVARTLTRSESTTIVP